MTSKEFNDLYPIGTKVIYQAKFLAPFESETRTPAWDICGSPCVSINGKAGGMDLDFIEVVK